MKNLVVLVSLVLAFNAYGQGSISVENADGSVFTRQIPTSKWIIRYKKDKADKVRNNLGRGRQNNLKHLPYIIADIPNEDRNRIVKSFEDSIESIVPDQLVHTCEVIDPGWTNQWDMTKINLEQAWNVTKGSSEIIIAILDTGIEDHPDLVQNLWTDPVTGAHGWECFNGNIAQNFRDYQGHATHVGGTIAAVLNNGIGITGIAPRCKIMSMAFLGSGGSGFYSDAIILIDKLIELKQSGLNIRVVNNSWGGGYTLDLLPAFQALEDAGILAVCAAGNASQNNDIAMFTPASLPVRSLISVAASDNGDNLATFSNKGFSTVDIAAPGVSIYSTMSQNTNNRLSNPIGYGNLSGTSMASPHVAGLAGLIFSANANLTVFEVRDLILNHLSYDLIPQLDNKCSTSGRINVGKTLTNPFVFNPRTNSIPTLNTIESQEIYGGQSISYHITGTDADNDPLSYSFFDSSGIIPQTKGQDLTVKAPYYPFDISLTINGCVSDGNGGVNTSPFYLNVKPIQDYLYHKYTLAAFAKIAYWNSPTMPALAIGANYTSNNKSNIQTLCTAYLVGTWGLLSGYYPTFNVGNTMNIIANGTNSAVRAWVIAKDTEYNVQKSEYVLVPVVEGQTDPGYPSLNVQLDKTVGVVPFSVNYDVTKSTSVNGLRFLSIFFPGEGFSPYYPMTGKLDFKTPGVYMLRFVTWDWKNLPDETVVVVSALAPTSNNPPLPPPVIAPTIIQQPVGSALQVGQTLTMNCLADGTEPLSYQWLKQGNVISGAINPVYTKSSVTLLDSGIYSVKVTNLAGVVYSLNAAVSVTNPPPPPMPKLSVIVTTDKTIYTSRQQVVTTVTIKSDNNNAAGVTVDYTIRNPFNSIVSSGTKLTTSSGVVMFNYNLNKNPKLGVYTIDIDASKLGYINGSGFATFTVKR